MNNYLHVEKNPMKGCILVLSVNISGINRYLFSELRKKDWELIIIDIPYPKICKYLAIFSTFKLNVTKWKKKSQEKLGRIKKSPWVFKWRTKYCERKIKQLNGSFNFIFQFSGMFSPSLDLEKFDIPYITYNDYTMKLSTKYNKWLPFDSKVNEWIKLESALYQNASMVLSTNENARKSFIDDYFINPDRVKTVGYGINLDQIPTINKKYDCKTILFIGIGFERKGGYVLLEAFAKVKNSIPDAKLLIVGPDKKQIRINQPGVEHLGFIGDRSMVEDLYRKASIFVMPSLCEPFGLAFLEAMAFKLPCIGTNIDAMSEIIEEGESGYLVPPGNIDELSHKILLLLKDAEKLSKMGNNGHRKVKALYPWEKVVERIDHAFSALCSQRYGDAQCLTRYPDPGNTRPGSEQRLARIRVWEGERVS
jgi:glycosyltransferase involved in cell wall biosynthesis